MFELEGGALRLGASASGWEEAVRQAGGLLVAAGRVEPAFVDSMLARERVGATCIGNGIAIPHGLRADRAMVRRTGIAGLQIPSGVPWLGGETVRLVFAIAARDEEHIAFLSRLTDVALHAETAERLARVTDAQEFVQLLRLVQAAPRAAAFRVGGEAETFPYQRDLAVPGTEGLHARPASIFAAIARKFGAEVRVRHGARDANGKSVAALLRLGVPSGGIMRLMTRGEDGELALAALADAIGRGLEGRDAFASPFLTVATPTAAHAAADAGYVGACIAGVPAAPGVVIGKVQVLDADPGPDIPGEGSGLVVETARLDQALAAALEQIRELHREAVARVGADKAGIIEAQADLIGDPGLMDDARVHLRAGRSAEWAWREATETAAEMIAALPNPTLAARAADIRDMARRVLRALAGTSTTRVVARHQAAVLAADDLCPSETVGLDRDRILALVTAKGGASAHTAILARALGIPAVVGVGDALAAAADGSTVIVDGDRGVVVVQPTIRDLGLAEHRRTDRDAALAASLAIAYQPAFTRDGLRIGVEAVVAGAGEAAAAVEAGAEGVGFARTEALFADRVVPPTEDEQREVYTAMVRAMNGLPLAIRALDPDGDRRAGDYGAPREANPLLGERGVRFAFARPDLFAQQLRALAAAATEGPVRLLLPFVTALADLRKAKALVEAARKAAGSPDLTVGAMIEIPAAAIMADRLAAEVDFLAIGTDELTQYALAVDRRHPRLAHLADDLHPSVLRLIRETTKAADAAGIPVGVTGSLASNARAVPLLIGLGVRELSATVAVVPIVKQRVRELEAERCRSVATRALACAEADDVRTLLWTEGL
jgi:multiphosphoryl transfer protein